METGKGFSELSPAGASGHPAEAGAAPVDGAVGQDEARRGLRLRQRHLAGLSQLLARSHNH